LDNSFSEAGSGTTPDLEALVARIQSGDSLAFEGLMRAHNQRLFRIARSIVQNDDDAEDVVQESYLSAYRNIQQYAGRATIGGWLARITVNTALSCLRRRGRLQRWEADVIDDDTQGAPAPVDESPEDAAASADLRRILERAVDNLPDKHRAVFMLRDIEGMSGSEVSDTLGLSEVHVRVALHRARAQIKAWLGERADRATIEAFGFAGERCDRIVATVLGRLGW
jgi:RNA polymerase sigma-70 factor (ECF subfamily)